MSKGCKNANLKKCQGSTVGLMQRSKKKPETGNLQMIPPPNISLYR